MLISVPDGSCSCLFCFQKKCEDRGQDQQEYPRPEFLDISPKPIISSSQRILKVHVHNHFQEYFVKKKKEKNDAISRNILNLVLYLSA